MFVAPASVERLKERLKFYHEPDCEFMHLARQKPQTLLASHFEKETSAGGPLKVTYLNWEELLHKRLQSFAPVTSFPDIDPRIVNMKGGPSSKLLVIVL